MNHEYNSSPEESGESTARKIGRTVLCMAGASLGLKIGENLAGFTLPYFVEMGIWSVTGSAAANIIAARREN